MDKEQLQRRLMATFLEELQEHVGVLNQAILGLEKDPADKEHVRTLFRVAHNLKGAARAVNLATIERTCHALEEILAGVRDSFVAIDAEMVAGFFQAVDALEEASVRLREDRNLADSPLATQLKALEAKGAAIAQLRQKSASQPVASSGAASSTSFAGLFGMSPGSFMLPPPPTPSLQTPPPPEVVETSIEPQPILAPVEPPALQMPVEETPEPVATAISAVHEALPAGGTLRIAAEKLDALVARSGELTVARGRLQSRDDDLTDLGDYVSRWRSEWRSVERWLARTLPNNNRGASEGALARTANVAVSERDLAALWRTGDRLRRIEKDIERLKSTFQKDERALNFAAGSLDAEVRSARMLPFAEACQGLDRMARDVAVACNREVELLVSGSDVELDRSVLERLKDPLRHMVRNAIAHGIEAPDDRRAKGKPAKGRIIIAAALRGAHVDVSVSDDGRGFEASALREQARRRHLPEPAEDRDLIQLIFLPGFSTAKIITDVSGRGVGLDVVKSQIEALHGTIDVDSPVGGGARFSLRVPLTLTTLRVLFLRAGEQTFAIAGANVHRLLRVRRSELRTAQGRLVLPFEGRNLAIVSLAETLQVSAAGKAQDCVQAVVVAAGEKKLAFMVDELIAEREATVKNLGVRIRRIRNVTGATILPTGEVVLVLNAADLIRSGQKAAGLGYSTQLPEEANAELRKKRVLIAEDSLTTRTLEKSILEAAGYEVLAAPDGASAWQLLQEQGADLLVSDVEMPRMDGFTLAQTVRESKRFREIPIILVTSRDSESDKARGISVGADAYLIKSAFDQRNLLETVKQLL